MIKFYLPSTRVFIVLMALVLSSKAFTQCANDNVFFLDLTPTGPGFTASTSCVWGGEYCTATVCQGASYTFSTCATSSFDTQITLYSAGGALLGYDDDFCAPQSSITWTATLSGQIRIVVDAFPCDNLEECANLAVTQNTSCPSSGTICDCDGTIHTDGVLEWIGDGFPDNNNYTWEGQFVNFNCATWGYDCGDIIGSPTNDPYGVCLGFLPPNNGCSLPSCDATNFTYNSFGCVGASEDVEFYAYFTGACEVYSLWSYTDSFGWEELVLGSGFGSGDPIGVFLNLPATEYLLYFELTDGSTSEVYSYTTLNCGGVGCSNLGIDYVETDCFNAGGTLYPSGDIYFSYTGDCFVSGVYTSVNGGAFEFLDLSADLFQSGDFVGLFFNTPNANYEIYYLLDDGSTSPSTFFFTGDCIECSINNVQTVAGPCLGLVQEMTFFVNYSGPCEVYSIWSFTDEFGWSEFILNPGTTSGEAIELVFNVSSTTYLYYFVLSDGSESILYSYTTLDCDGGNCTDLSIDYNETECFDAGGTLFPSGDIFFDYAGDCLVDGIFTSVNGGAFEYLDLSASQFASGEFVELFFGSENANYEIYYILDNGSTSPSVFFFTQDCTNGGVTTICDCAGTQHTSGVLSWLGDGFADDSSYEWEGQLVDFNCETWGFDCGDILDAPIYDPYAVCYGNLPPANGCAPADCYPLEFDVLTDCYPEEISMAVFNEFGEQIYFAPEGSYIELNTLYTSYLCLPPGCYTMVMYDSFGDGLSSEFCDADGGYGVWDPESQSYIITGPALYGFSYELDFCTPVENNCTNLALSISPEPCTPNGDVFSPSASYIFDFDGGCEVAELYLSLNGEAFEGFDVSEEAWSSGDAGNWFFLAEDANYIMYYILDDGTVSPLFNFNTGNCNSEVTICDCAGTQLSIGVLSWLGDGFADNGFYQWGDQFVDFNCATWGYDCGDIDGAPTSDPYNVCEGGLPPFNGCGNEEILGCTDPDALNYNPDATLNDGSCIYNQLVGCTDPLACNFNEQALVDNGTCEYATCAGCTDEEAVNYDPTATIDDGSCSFEDILGCTDNDALNYNPIANVDDGSCVFSCVFPEITYDAYCVPNESDVFYILVDINSLGNGAPYTLTNTADDTQVQVNFSGNVELGPFDNDQQVVVQVVSNLLDGCFITSAVLTEDCSSGVILGCTDPLAANYYELAEVEDGSCIYDFMICDCDNNTFSPDVRFNLGDENADTGTGANPNFNCAAWGYDCGDIAGAPNEDPYNVCSGSLANELIATVTGCPLSVNELELTQWSVYPNPTQGLVLLQNGGNIGKVVISVIDLAGRIVKTELVNVPQRSTYQLDLSTFANGSYTIQINKEGSLELDRKSVV